MILSALILGIISLCACEKNSSSKNSAGLLGLLSANINPRAASSTIVFSSDRGGNYGIYAMNTDGNGIKKLTDNTLCDNWWPRISHDRKKILLYRAPAGMHENYSEASPWVMNADVSGCARLTPVGN